MAKDLTEEVSKKPRKTKESGTGGKSNSEASNGKEPLLSTYLRANAFEDQEAEKRDPATDLRVYKDVCAELASHICRIAELKSQKPHGWTAAVSDLKISAAILPLYMKKLNRIEKIRSKSQRETVSTVRLQVDVRQLQLQNLICEIQHLKREVDKCLQFKSKPLGVDLVPVDEFYESAPKSISRPEVTKSDQHQLQLARLEWELKQRKELSALCSQFEEKKKALSNQLKKKENDLNSLAPLIKNVLAVAQPMQEKLGFTPSQPLYKEEICSLLPHPLYFLFKHASAYNQASDKFMKVTISGDEEKAKDFSKEKVDDLENSNSELSDKEELSSTKKALKHRKEKLLEKHPLVVSIDFDFKDELSLSLVFAFIPQLNIMTVTPTLTVPRSLESSSCSHVLQSQNLLTNLFPGDSGLESPNVANYYQFQEVRLESFNTKKLGSPYIWVQKLGGLDFGGLSPGKSGKLSPQQNVAKTNLPMVMKEIRRRVKARLALARQVQDIEKGIVVGPSEMKSVKISSELRSWESISWSDYRKQPAAAHLKDTEYISPVDLFFKATIQRGKAKLIALVAVKPNYPLALPVTALEFEWENHLYYSATNTYLLNIEKEINVHWDEFVTSSGWANSILSYHVHRIIISFEIFLECSYPEEFKSEKKTFFHPHRGRNRVHPLKYIQMGEGVFVQR